MSKHQHRPRGAKLIRIGPTAGHRFGGLEASSNAETTRAEHELQRLLGSGGEDIPTPERSGEFGHDPTRQLA